MGDGSMYHGSNEGPSDIEEAPPTRSHEPQQDGFEERGNDVQLAALYGALATARGQFGAIAKDRDVTVVMKSGQKYTFSYADLASLLAATTPALAANGLAIMSPFTRTDPRVMTQSVILAHKDGGRLIFTYKFAPPQGDDLKTLGGHQTYLTRYAYRSILVLPGGEDADDMPEQGRGEANVQGAAKATANGSQTQRMPPVQERAPSVAPPPANDESRAEAQRAANRVAELRAALKSCNYILKNEADIRIAKALNCKVADIAAWPNAGKLTARQHDILMNALLDEKAAGGKPA